MTLCDPDPGRSQERGCDVTAATLGTVDETYVSLALETCVCYLGKLAHPERQEKQKNAAVK